MSSLFSSINLNSPLSLYSIPVIWFTSFYPHSLKFLKIDNTIGYVNTRPRWNNANNLKEKLPANLTTRFERMEGAHNNGNEAMPLWFAAVIAGNIAGLDNRYLNTMALTYVATRFAYNTVYIYYNDLGKGWARTFLYFFGLSYPLRILFKAAAKVAATGK
ncbi:hypothetical protein GALMADRAFT_242430 [Galerina marginata CBS 339.88]|uniref:Uncharacterized protein n=1 Tax=Galerina marginata (strain CBS 339.88) TaxID=685588 RepID=A0A067TAI5_GALM3|nr:hypothetical protein GALMADRAFT_242430 [Galerina marginata CBS 339.88]